MSATPEGVGLLPTVEPVPVSPLRAAIPSAEDIWREAYVSVYGCDPSHPSDAYKAAYTVIDRAMAVIVVADRRYRHV